MDIAQCHDDTGTAVTPPGRVERFAGKSLLLGRRTRIDSSSINSTITVSPLNQPNWISKGRAIVTCVDVPFRINFCNARTLPPPHPTQGDPYDLGDCNACDRCFCWG